MKTEVKRYYEDGSAVYEPGVIICECNSSDHSIIYWKEENYYKCSQDTPTREVYMGISLNLEKNFKERLKSAFKYLFKKERQIMYAEIIINKDNISGLEDIVEFINEQ